MNIEKIFSLSDAKLKNALRTELCKLGYVEGNLHNKKDFLYAEGDTPYMLIAHLDTVHKITPSIICYSKDGNYMMSPQGIGGDDRCGVYIILELLNKLPFRPYVLFTMGEEIGGIGANAFIEYIIDHDIPNLKYIVEYDRKGNNDCVFYKCDNPDFTKFVEQFGFKEAYGTFSDISVIAPELGVAAVNLSSGYYSPHTEHEYVSIKDMHDIITKSLKMFDAESEYFEYIEQEYNYNYSYYKRRVEVSFVPAGALYISSVYADKTYTNTDFEIAVDRFGNFYRYDYAYGDLGYLYNDIAPTEGTTLPTFDENDAIELPFYYGAI